MQNILSRSSTTYVHVIPINSLELPEENICHFLCELQNWSIGHKHTWTFNLLHCYGTCLIPLEIWAHRKLNINLSEALFLLISVGLDQAPSVCTYMSDINQLNQGYSELKFKVCGESSALNFTVSPRCCIMNRDVHYNMAWYES